MTGPPPLLLALVVALTGDPVGDYRAGLAAEKAGDDATAARLLGRAMAEAPAWELPPIDLAQLRLREGQAAQARELAAGAVRLDAANARGWHLLSLSAEATGDAAVAEQAERRALALRPEFPGAGRHLAQLLWNEGKHGPAIDELLQLAGAHPGDASLLAMLASAEEEDGRLDAAEQALRLLAEMEPKNPVWHRRLGRLLEGEGKTAAARVELARAEQLSGPHRASRHLRPLLPSKR